LRPILLEFGTEEQKKEFLPKISRGEIWWCQGFSEPGAGSGLANISTRANLKNDEYIINGSKIWTSEANKADWMYCLVRTLKTEKKQKGISFILLDLKQPNIEIKPIKLLSGHSPFCQVFFDGVIAKESHRVAEENDGWKVAKRLLQFERTMMAALESEGAINIEPLEVLDKVDEINVYGNKKLYRKIVKHEMRNQLIELSMSRAAIIVLSNCNNRLATFQPSFSSATRWDSFAITPSKKTWQNGECPLSNLIGLISIFGCFKSNKINDIPFCFFSVFNVLTRQYIQSALFASEVHIFEPLIIYSSFLRFALVEILAKPDPAPGSENP
jgi:hypothetical protein